MRALPVRALMLIVLCVRACVRAYAPITCVPSLVAHAAAAGVVSARTACARTRAHCVVRACAAVARAAAALLLVLQGESGVCAFR